MPASTSAVAIAGLAVLCLLLLSSPRLAAADVPSCSAGSCPLDSGGAGCSLCASNSSACSAAWYDTAGHYCGAERVTSRQNGGVFLYPSCCPAAYPCVPNSYAWQDAYNASWDVTSYWCTVYSPSSLDGGDHSSQRVWLWFVFAALSAALFSAALYVHRRCEARRVASAAQQQWPAQPQQELLGQSGPWSDEAAERGMQSIRQPPSGSNPTYQPPGTYARMS